jgi:hypothetical protein
VELSRDDEGGEEIMMLVLKAWLKEFPLFLFFLALQEAFPGLQYCGRT